MIRPMDRQERAELVSRLRRDARLIADHFGLDYRDIAAEDPRVKSRYGICYEDGLIKIRLNHARTGEPLKYSSLIDTLCHELAHLRHFNHGPEFKAFFFTLLGWARQQGIYRPGPVRSPAPRPVPAPALPLEVLEPPRRNGVPVFVREESPSDSVELPWHRPPPAPARPPAPRPRRPEQLDLF